MKNKKQDNEKLPQHIAIMIDGNRRWAKKHGLSAYEGHRAGIKRVVSTIRYALKREIKVLTLYGFSTENWKRTPDEVNHLMSIFIEFAQKYAPEFKKQGIQFRHLGSMDKLPVNLQKALKMAQKLMRNNKKMILNIALNYGGRDEVKRAVQKIIRDKIPAEKINEQIILNHLDTKGLPDPDLVIRPSGVLRMSNFLPLQSVYSELYFPKIYWPDFDEHQFDLALKEYARRQRRFGK